MRWVEALMINLYTHAGASGILETDRWTGQQHVGSPRAYHARFMRPTYRLHEHPHENLTCMTLFMPYLHWDVVAQPGVPISVEEPGERPATRYQKLLAAYRDNDHPLHVRRTLDQYFYHTLQNTRSRDMDQVISRFQREHALKPSILTMVDQLWLWVVNKTILGNKSRTIITCFPQVTTKSDRIDVPDCGGFADVLAAITLNLRKQTSQRWDLDELIPLIMGTCSRSYMDPSSHLLFGETIVRFSDVYESTIKAAMDQEAEIFQQFSESTNRSDLVDITREVSLLREMKDVVDELNIMSGLFRDQLGVYNQDLSQGRIFDHSKRFSEASLNKIQSMIPLARKVTDDLQILVDLKQKHSTMMDARATARQGKTLMVFTVVTIVFLPLSFMAAFFAINITQFRRDEGDTLDLAYVSQIMFPISAAITAILIYFAFKVEDLEIRWQKIASKKTKGGSKAVPVGAKEEAPTAKWNKRESRDLTGQSARIRRKTSTTKEDTVVSKGKEVVDRDVEAQRDAADSN
ncbi:hypothetical protein EDB81DRAFT_831460 [Dactylonectria macrodidyma]|uniref:Uncharacterized protein n=1 Tax=Dactylonectria macrodidyma TaxID=307937 RepID=A0A9P9D0X6_9HYPO|nr:hypothetical protein EDB81DRAFT_831460 [Dactylonectria macrodidyma]